MGLETWHSYRIPIILSTASLLLLLRIYLHFTEDREELLVFPKIYGTNNDTEKELSKRQNEGSSLADAVKKTDGPRRIRGSAPIRTKNIQRDAAHEDRQIQCHEFFSSLTTNTEKRAKGFARDLALALQSLPKPQSTVFAEPEVLDLTEVEYDEYFITPPNRKTDSGASVDLFYLFLIPSYNIDTINDTFLEHLRETHHDFRIDTSSLAALLGYSVFGFGDKEGWPTEDEGFCFQAKEVDKWMAKLTGRKRAYPVGMGDLKQDGAQRMAEWSQGVTEVLDLLAKTGALGEGVPGSGEALESDEEFDEEDYDGETILEDVPKPSISRSKDAGRLDDVEDLGNMIVTSAQGSVGRSPPVAVDFTSYGKLENPNSNIKSIKEMVPKDSPTFKALKKQGYTIVGSHSGVKICRWTKSALRGRGSCYKFSFYGINSHQCMETTPSLSCSNKCIFCWRHGTNPVGTSWRWVIDPPQLIFDGVKAGHYQKIKMMRGVPGVRSERFAEANRIRHCALSLVGEPIFYPHINEFLALLHGERISSFLVCNAQHPDQLAALKHVTQLYVSIDASNKESLKRIDRPLHRDFWERFQRCLEIMREKRFRQRTVFRLTLVKGFNIDDEVKGYADLVEKALPCFVEVKGVTFCGTSTSSSVGLRMDNVPFYHEVCDFVTALEAELRTRGLEYGLAAEHSHSCCVLLASERFKVNGKWHTLIDYERFFQLLEKHGPDGDFSPEDYMGPPTPEWATWGNGGFDPRDARVDRKGRPVVSN
jgi:tRNA wybutosine-synthesizing protein 1